MENQQPEALETASRIELAITCGFIGSAEQYDHLLLSAVSQLRRLHARVEELESVGANHIAQPTQMATTTVVLPEPIGTVGAAPGTSGFTLTVFEAARVPVGTNIYTEQQVRAAIAAAVATEREAHSELNHSHTRHAMQVLPDGSAFAIYSYPLPKDHWLYAPREYEQDSTEPKELAAPILTQAHRGQVASAIRYAVRGATNCGKEDDFDPDALVLNAVYALCGPVQPKPQTQAAPHQADARDVEEAFKSDDEDRANGKDYRALGHDCDRRSWEQVRKLWRNEGASPCAKP